MQNLNVTINGEPLVVYQHPLTGLFYTIQHDGHIPVGYDLIKDKVTIGQKIKYWRCQYGYSQADLAALVHVASKTVVAMWEHGRRKPREKTLRLLARHLDFDSFTPNEDDWE